MTIQYINSINTPIFIFGLLFGLLTAFLILKPKRFVYKIKTEDGKLVYEDLNDKCFKYVAEEIKCPGLDDFIDHPKIYN